MQLRWIASQSASCFHAAAALAAGESLADAELGAALGPPTGELQAELAEMDLPTEAFWQQVVPLAAGIENNRQLADVCLRKLISHGRQEEAKRDRLARAFDRLEGEFRRAVPGVVEQLELRGRPLREQWEARGPGLHKAVATLTDPALLVENAEVVLVHPALGGGGAAHLHNNSVRIEAVLANADFRLPEILRLGWLLAQLQCDLPMHGEGVSAGRLPLVSAAALLPPTLAAGEVVELTRYDRETLAAACAAWRIPAPPGCDLPQALETWWATYLKGRPPWNVALAALDAMLAPEAT